MVCPKITDLPVPPNNKTGWPWTEATLPLPPTMPDGSPWSKISIVTPSFNQAQFLEETIRSVLLQGYPNLEYIIIDGGSTDGSVEIIKKYEPWLTYWVSEKDHGQADAINKGWKISTGEYLSWINSDDVLKPGSLRNVVEQFKLTPEVGLIYGDNEETDETSKVLSVLHGKQVEFTEMLRSIYVPVPQPGSVLRRSALDSVGYLNEEWQVVLDRDFFVRFGQYYKMLYVPKVLAQIRQHPAAKSFAARSKWCTELPEMYKEYFRNQDLPQDIKKLRFEAIGRAYAKAADIALHTGKHAIGKLILAALWYPPLLRETAFSQLFKRWINHSFLRPFSSFKHNIKLFLLRRI